MFPTNPSPTPLPKKNQTTQNAKNPTKKKKMLNCIFDPIPIPLSTTLYNLFKERNFFPLNSKFWQRNYFLYYFILCLYNLYIIR